MNLRELVGIEDEPYFKFNREERQLAAILFYLLNCSNNVERLLGSIDDTWKINSEEFGIYLEYSYPRDLWHRLDFTDWKKKTWDTDVDAVNKRKRDAIINILKKALQSDVAFAPEGAEQFNAFFIGKGSKQYIQSPATWHLPTFFKNIIKAYSGEPSSARSALEAACKLKWGFRIKPDLVIHADREHVLCVELKLESGESSYPSNEHEIELLRSNGMSLVRQTALQKFLMEEFLGFRYCRSILISNSPSSDSTHFSWKQFMDRLQPLPDMPRYMSAAIDWAQDHRIVRRPRSRPKAPALI